MAARTTTSDNRRTTARAGGTVALLAVLAGAIGLGSGAAADAATPVSQARGQFLSGTIGGRDLSAIASIAGVDAQNFGGSPVVRSNTLQASALNSINLPLTGVLQLPGGNIVNLGAVGQFSRANGDGSASAASGAIGNSGGIGIGSAPGGLPADATIVLPGPSGSPLGSIRIEVGAVSASATQQAGTTPSQAGGYRIASLAIDLSSPALAGAGRQLRAAVPGVPVKGLGQLPAASGLATLSAAGGAVTADLATGTVRIDVAALLTSVGLDLNRLPANTHLLPYLTRALGTLAPTAAQDAFGPLANALSSALDVIVNGQEVTGGTFTQQAVEVNLGSGASGAQLVLASASVGPSGPAPARVTAAPAAPAAPTVQQGRSPIKIDAGRADTTSRAAATPAGATVAAVALLVLAGSMWRLVALRRRG